MPALFKCLQRLCTHVAEATLSHQLDAFMADELNEVIAGKSLTTIPPERLDLIKGECVREFALEALLPF